MPGRGAAPCEGSCRRARAHAQATTAPRGRRARSSGRTAPGRRATADVARRAALRRGRRARHPAARTIAIGSWPSAPPPRRLALPVRYPVQRLIVFLALVLVVGIVGLVVVRRIAFGQFVIVRVARAARGAREQLDQ